MTGFASVSRIDISAPPEEVWAALTDAESFGKAMFDTEVVTDWGIGGSIVYRGEYEGKPFEDKGEVIELSPPTRMRVTHFSPAGGDADKRENYHELRFDLEPFATGTHVTLTQDNNATERAATHSQGNWDTMLGLLKKVVEA
jgi:uncharacterized protein YndB with AHSA1/START domain